MGSSRAFSLLCISSTGGTTTAATMVKFESRRHRIISLPPPRRPRHGHLLHLIRVLPCQVQQTCSHDVLHCRLVSCFFFAVHLLHTMMVIDRNTWYVYNY
ncbi:hypothetical protein EV702DRAFT_1104464 [Suillus placidus]|uniref:Uncharacterized protein n=1 Tax=Suillus placidus TaxID=48579 RepID=A0A9P6ZV00_9AGAM|nr:hypothetical protein EV702DRAFT_1104464 [Suillus placidus]